MGKINKEHQSFLFFYLFTLIFFLLAGCEESPIFFRIGANYFPIENVGNEWVYVSENGDTILVKVVEKTVRKESECYLLERNGEEEYWRKSEYNLDKLYTRTINIGGKIDTVANFWVSWLELPLINGNSWENMYAQKTYCGEDTVKIEVTLKGAVISIEREKNYEVRLVKAEKFFSRIFGDSSLIDTIYEYYAPDTGITKRLANNREEVLYSFIPNK